MAVRWVKCLVPFQTLSVRDQVCTYFNFVFKNFLIIRDHSSITSSKRWVGGVRKMAIFDDVQHYLVFMLTFSTIYADVGWVGQKKSKKRADVI